MSFFKDKKILVTGATGFVGRNLIDKLLQLDSTIRATIHRRDPLINDNRLEYIKVDLTRMEDCL